MLQISDCVIVLEALREFAGKPQVNLARLPGGLEILWMYLIEDGLLKDTGVDSGISVGGVPVYKVWRLTQKGRDFITKWLANEELE